MKDDPFSTVLGGLDEVYTSTAYYYDNSLRENRESLVIQRTLSGTVFFKDENGRQLVPANHVMLFSHNEKSSYGYPKEATEPYCDRYLAFSKSASLAKLFDAVRKDFGSVVRMPDESQASELFDEIFERQRTRRFHDRFHEAELLHRLVIALYREQVHNTRTTDPIEYGHHWMRDHFRSPLNLKGVAAKCGVSREHFIREFTARYHEPPGRWLRQLRLEHARVMLAATPRAVEDVAVSCGFAGANAFCRAYRAHFGHSPRAKASA